MIKFKVQKINVRSTPDYPYTHRVEFWCSKEELLPVGCWVKDRAIPCCWAGFTLYLRERDLDMFLLRWS